MEAVLDQAGEGEDATSRPAIPVVGAYGLQSTVFKAFSTKISMAD
ncbi:hypothetical protein [Desulfobotulus mexicanus]|nr:hypothetical protein [Desulfobotulus mexicanus]